MGEKETWALIGNSFSDDVSFLKGLIEKGKIGEELLSYSIGDFKSEKAKQIVDKFLNDKSRGKPTNMLLDLNALLSKLEASNHDREDVKDKANFDLYKDISVNDQMKFKNITFNQALQEYNRHIEVYIKENSLTRLKKAMLYFNIIMKKTNDNEKEKILDSQMQNLEKLLLQNNLYKDLDFKELKDLKDISLPFHLAKNELDKCMLNDAQKFFKIMINVAQSDKEKEIVRNTIKTKIREIKAKLGWADKLWNHVVWGAGDSEHSLQIFLFEYEKYARTWGIDIEEK